MTRANEILNKIDFNHVDNPIPKGRNF